MIITRTPLRISFCGGGTDLPSYYNREQGAVVSSSVNKYIYITINRLSRYFDHRISLKYSRTELVNSVDEVVHPIIREAMKLTASAALPCGNHSAANRSNTIQASGRGADSNTSNAGSSSGEKR